MTIGTSVFLIAVGAILRYAIHGHISGFDIHVAGLILMIVGAFGLILGLYFTFVRGTPDPTVGDRRLVRRRTETRYE